MVDRLAQRVEALERQNRRLRAWATGLTGCLVVIVLLGAQARVPDVLITKMLKIVDQNGKPRIAVGVHETGHGMLVFTDADGKTPRLTLTVHANGVEQALFDNNGKKRVELTADEEAALRFLDPLGKVRMLLRTAADGHASQDIADAEGRVLSRIPAE